ncbi:hypothetical protein V1225_10440 [Emergencia sp. JLR.KK010]|uniref:hypothetical protein n=1 Tax=Emergencia sp. JLR.KK010 TaxID=3114296 RepID=UPI0030CFF26C
MNIKIGNNNKISSSTIANTVNGNMEFPKKSWYEKHPIIGGIIVSVIAGVILIFSFWADIVKFIEGVL